MTKSLWKAKASNPKFPSLQQDAEVDVAIVGGGITGVTSAYLLSHAGYKVAVLESHEIGGGTTAGSTGNLYTMIDTRLHHIQSKFDDKTARVVAESRTAAVNFIEDLVKQHQIDCGYKRQPWFLYSESEESDKTIEKEKESLKKFGLKVTEESDLPLPFKIKSAIKVDGQAQFNPADFVAKLAGNVNKENCTIYENTKVQKIEKGDPHILHTSTGLIRAKKIILATHIPKGVYPLQTAVYPYREYALAVKLKSGEYPEGIFWSTEAENHQSVRSYETDEGKLMIVVGQHHKVGQGEEGKDYFFELESNVRKYFDILSVEYKWSAQHYKPSDGLPFIGESSDENIFVATGFSTDGLTYGVVSAMIINDLIAQRENPWAKIYDAKRFTPLKSAKSFMKENLNVLGEYIKDITKGADIDHFNEVKPGEGKIMEVDDEKWAVHRSEDGELCASSAVCPHLACLVNWNNLEKTWDCPCHGSRFKATGEVIEGPAYSALPKRKIDFKK